MFDASHRSSTGVLLNDILHPGPRLQINSSDILIWLRRHRFVFGTDIVKMFRQIRVQQDDWDYQRLLWKDDNGQPIEYQLTTVTYGTSCAPWVSLRVLKQLAIDEVHRFPLALPTFIKRRYVDDIYGGAETEHQLEEIIKQLINLCMTGGMPLQKWCSNVPHILKRLGLSSGLAPTIEFEESTVKVLGLCWQPQADTFHYKAKSFNRDTITKRVILQELQQLSSLSIPRWLNLSPKTTEVQLHGFADASNLAMGASVYLRASSATSGTTVTLICAKTKVAPLKKMTIPWLELTAALLATDLVAYVQRTLDSHPVQIAKADALLIRYSSLTKLLRITAWIHGAARCFQRQPPPESPQLGPQELEEARLYWVRMASKKTKQNHSIQHLLDLPSREEERRIIDQHQQTRSTPRQVPVTVLHPTPKKVIVDDIG
ncbi:uncharacterized protein LOC107044249 [Diachasma alloeum]|uniref:uncharacterized protein LOC107044249 n=1 Tax=Diachasma alloeum TaxID=454923 RepID=UPI0007384684|nr:uncharacterized protein LOC107044249 [Diachasma alloeum]